MYNNPSVQDFKNRFNRDFPYNADINLGVTDTDIANAFQDVNNSINSQVWESQAAWTAAYLMLSAHFLCMNINAASQGLAGQAGWIQTSKGVGSVSEGFSVPQRILDNPTWAALSKTTYGMRYLTDMLIPRSVAVCASFKGRTNP